LIETALTVELGALGLLLPVGPDCNSVLAKGAEVIVVVVRCGEEPLVHPDGSLRLRVLKAKKEGCIEMGFLS
jgi:hypothetical protein